MGRPFVQKSQYGRKNKKRSWSGAKEGELSCEAAAELLLFGGSEIAVAAAQQHRSGCVICGAGPTKVAALPQPSRWHRVALAVLFVAQTLASLPWLFGFDPLGLTAWDQAHLTRDGAVGVVVASAGALVLWRPRYAQAGFIFGAVGVVLQAVAAVFDGSNQKLGAADELVHVISLVLVVIVGLVALTMKVSPRLVLAPSEPDQTEIGLRAVSAEDSSPET